MSCSKCNSRHSDEFTGLCSSCEDIAIQRYETNRDWQHFEGVHADESELPQFPKGLANE